MTNDSTKIFLSLRVNDAQITGFWRHYAIGNPDENEKGSTTEIELFAKEHFDHNVKQDVEYL